MQFTSLITNTFGRWRAQPTVVVETDRFPDVSAAPPDSRRLIRDRRYCRVLADPRELPFDEVSVACAWKALEYQMALVPGGDVCLINGAFQDGSGAQVSQTTQETVSVETFYLDRDCITNADFARFVQAGGYGDPNLWPEETLPNVLQFVDQTGQPGPRFWSGGQPDQNKLDHPVVGICWYEANAFATWAGKRLPTSEEWQRAGTWSQGICSETNEQRFPWGNAFNPANANLWSPGRQVGTCSVSAINAGKTPNGVRQLIGNVWEWVDTQFYPVVSSGLNFYLNHTMAEIRGGAFDTYFSSQATCQFRTGQSLLYRGANVGFRCCISADILPAHPENPVDVPPTTTNEQ